MRLHYMPSMNPRKVCALAKHLQIPLEYELVDVRAGGLRSPRFLALNPNGRVPVLEDGERVIWESAAIMVHLASKAGSDMWPLHDVHKQVEIVRWLSWDASDYGVSTGTYYFENFIKPNLLGAPPDQSAIDAVTRRLHDSARVLDAHLANNEYLVGSSLTIADFVVAVLLPMANEIGLPVERYSNIQRWGAALMKLEAWRDPWPAEASGASRAGT